MIWMSKNKRFKKLRIPDETYGGIYDSETDKILKLNDVEHNLNEMFYALEEAKISILLFEDDVQVKDRKIEELEKENTELRNQLEIERR